LGRMTKVPSRLLRQPFALERPLFHCGAFSDPLVAVEQRRTGVAGEPVYLRPAPQGVGDRMGSAHDPRTAQRLALDRREASVALPRVGVNNQPGDFEYAKIA
jgi:hypothetical protein